MDSPARNDLDALVCAYEDRKLAVTFLSCGCTLCPIKGFPKGDYVLTDFVSAMKMKKDYERSGNVPSSN